MSNSNSEAMLRGFIERLQNLNNDVKKLTGLRKEKAAFFKDHKLPGALMIKLSKGNAEDRKDAADQLVRAGAIMGIPVFAGEVAPEPVHDVTESILESAREYVDEIKGVDEDIEATKADFKEVLDEAKSAGFTPKIIRQILKYLEDPTTFEETSALFNVYRKALEPKPMAPGSEPEQSY